VRGYAVGEATSDEWQLFSTEYRVNIPQKELPGTFTFAAFYDWARGEANRLPQPAEIRTNTRTLQAAGFGLTWSRQDDFLVRLSLAWRLTGSPISDPIDRKPRLYFQLQKNL
jgi:hemolysin activation/secretion protein